MVGVPNNFPYNPTSSLISGENLFRCFVNTLFELKKKDKRFNIGNIELFVGCPRLSSGKKN